MVVVSWNVVLEVLSDAEQEVTEFAPFDEVVARFRILLGLALSNLI